MRTVFTKTLLTVAISAMVTLAVLGVYIIVQRSDDNPIVAPAPTVTSVPQLPSQAPRVGRPTKRGAQPGYNNLDTPSPK